MRRHRSRNIFDIPAGRRTDGRLCPGHEREFSVPAYFAATLLDFWAARSRSITLRQPVLRSDLCLNMQAVIFETFGISLLQRRKASLVHIDCASELKAKLEVADSAENETAMARAKPA